MGPFSLFGPWAFQFGFDGSSAHFSEIFFLTLRKALFSPKMVLYVGFVGNPGSG